MIGDSLTDIYEESVIVHRQLRGKISVVNKLPFETQEDPPLACTPVVAQPCELIAKDPAAAFDLTIKRNAVAIISDGSAVIGLGNIGASGAIPVMKGKAMLFREFASIDAWPICLNTQNADWTIEMKRRIAPVFGGVNSEGISAPQCFEVEKALQDLGMSVFHDDQLRFHP